MTTWSQPPVPARLCASAQVPFVGRHAELRVLEDVWSAVSRDVRQAVFVGGEPGAGKTRLLAEIATVLAEHDVAVLMGTSSDYGLSYQPFVEALDHLFTTSRPGSLADLLDDTAAELARLTPHVARHLPEGHRSAGPVSELRHALFDATVGLFRALTRQRPVVLILDDLQWADVPTLALLSHVISTIVDARLLVLAAFRTTAPDRSDQLTTTIADLYRLEGVRRIDLAGLDTDDITEYLMRVGGTRSSAARASAPVLRDQTGGNPFFLRELWRDLQHRGGVSALRSGRVPAPRSVRDTLEPRLSGLGATALDVIEVAAVIGDSFEVAMLAAADDAAPIQILAALDAASALGLIEPVGDDTGVYTFIHALLRQAVLDQLSPSRRAELHARAATALEARSTEPQVIPGLAHHYLRCQILGYGHQAVHYATESARLAERSLAFEEAAAWFERGAAVSDVDTGERTELLLAAAADHTRAGSFARARELHEQLATSRDPVTRLRAAVGYEDASWRPGLPGSRQADLLTEALEATALEEDDPRSIAALASLGRALTFAGQAAGARQVGTRAIELARRHGDEALQAHALCTSLWHGLAPEDARIQLERAREVVDHSVATGDPDLLNPASYFRAVASYTLGRPNELDTSISDYRRTAMGSGEPFITYIGGCLEQGRSFQRGDLQGAQRQAEQLLELAQAFGTDDAEGSYGLQVFMVQRENGQLESLRDLITGDEALRGHWVPGLLALYTELDQRSGMHRALQQVLATLSNERVAGSQWPAELAFTVEAALALQDTQALDRLHPYLVRHQGLNLVTGEFVATFGAADRFLARIASVRGEHDRAEQLFRTALAMDESMGALVHTAETLVHHGLHLLGAGDGSRARPLLERARDIAEQIGQQRVLRLIPVQPTGGAPAGLTEREVEVLCLLAEGLSNREIGERLYISANTAANHVRSILMKTGAANRTQAAMYAAEHHLA